jgi:hypothetical protein
MRCTWASGENRCGAALENMSHHRQIVQVIGGCVEYALWFGAGAYLAWFWPRRVHRDVQSGKISEERGRQKLKKFSPLLGYLVMIAAIVFALSKFF